MNCRNPGMDCQEKSPRFREGIILSARPKMSFSGHPRRRADEPFYYKLLSAQRNFP